MTKIFTKCRFRINFRTIFTSWKEVNFPFTRTKEKPKQNIKAIKQNKFKQGGKLKKVNFFQSLSDLSLLQAPLKTEYEFKQTVFLNLFLLNNNI